ncbi:MAG TPA: c-type cytochrome [Alphaproteobacteria bacterium]|nr:c-type cytochrome [Alphaproteobacteria bacterium]
MRTLLSLYMGLYAVVVLAFTSPCAGAGQPTRPVPPGGAGAPAAPTSELRPGPAVRQPEPVKNPYAGDPQAIAQGQKLYQAFNCVGCHFNGGGGIGPPLMDRDWIYGGEPANIFQSIAQGRPNGMPAYGVMLPDDQIWILAAYVQSLSESGASSSPP